VSAREALNHVIAHIDAEIVELYRRRGALQSGTRSPETGRRP
jgi:hypothetical protein